MTAEDFTLERTTDPNRWSVYHTAASEKLVGTIVDVPGPFGFRIEYLFPVDPYSPIVKYGISKESAFEAICHEYRKHLEINPGGLPDTRHEALQFEDLAGKTVWVCDGDGTVRFYQGEGMVLGFAPGVVEPEDLSPEQMHDLLKKSTDSVMRRILAVVARNHKPDFWLAGSDASSEPEPGCTPR